MPWVGSDFQRVHNFSADASSGINILASRQDAEFDGIATGLEACLKLDGTNAPAADFPMAGYKHTNVAAAASTNQYLRLDQFQQLTPIFCAYGGVAEAMSVSTSPTFAALVSGHCIIVSCPSANTAGTSVTINLNGIGAQPVRHADGVELAAGDVKGSRQYIWNGTYFALMNRRSGGVTEASTAFTSAVTFSGSVSFGPSSNIVVSGSASFTSATIFDGFTQVDIGYRDMPVVGVDVGRELSAADRAHLLYHTTTSVCSMTIPTCASVAYPLGTAILIVNGPSGGVVSVSAASGVTQYRAGTGSTGTRILSAACEGLFKKVASDTWYAGGSGLT